MQEAWVPVLALILVFLVVFGYLIWDERGQPYVPLRPKPKVSGRELKKVGRKFFFS